MHVILDAFSHTFLQFIALFGMLFVGGIALTVISKLTSTLFQTSGFPKFGIYVFGAIGVPFHELCHAIFCKLFAHDIQSIKWFDPRGKGGSFGAVTHSYNPNNLYHRMGHFFIGLGPTLLAPIALALLFTWLVPGAHAFHPFAGTGAVSTAKGFLDALFHRVNFTSWSFYIFLYLAICISSQVELSPEDLNQVKLGIPPILLCLLIFNLIASALGAHWHSHVVQWGWHFMLLSGCLFTFAAAVALLNLAICAVIFRSLRWTRAGTP